MLKHITIERTSTTDRVVQALREEVLSGNLRPGTAISEVEVSQNLGISRNTLREAIQQLEFAGLLSWRGNRRVVTVPSADDVRDIYRVRLLLEVGGIEASKDASKAELANLQAAFDGFAEAVHNNAIYEIVEQNIAFHAATVAFLRSPRLIHTYQQAMSQMQLAFIYTDQDRNDQFEQIEIHKEILESVQSGQIAKCVKLLKRNYQEAEAQVLDSLKKRLD